MHKFLLWLMMMLAVGTFVFGILQFARRAQTPAAPESAGQATAVSNAPSVVDEPQ